MADIQFAYHNGELIKALQGRGLLIKNSDWEKLKTTTATMDQLKRNHFQEFVVPVRAFITFESEEGFQRMLTC